MKNRIYIISSIIAALVSTSTPAYAHVVVKPSETGVATYETYTISVPNEKTSPVTSLRLLIPEGVTNISPNVKPGWTIEIKKSGSEEDAIVTEIDWSGGSIPDGQRDDFFFNAKAPSSPATLVWKAYQTYQNGDTVSWDQTTMGNLTDDQREEMEKAGKGPASQTNVINDLTGPSKPETPSSSRVPFGLSIVALALSAFALSIALKKK